MDWKNRGVPFPADRSLPNSATPFRRNQRYRPPLRRFPDPQAQSHSGTRSKAFSKLGRDQRIRR